MRIYTKTGDGGATSLIGGERVSKADLRVEAYGTVDELAAHLAMLADLARTATDRLGGIVASIETIQSDLMVVEAMIASSGSRESDRPDGADGPGRERGGRVKPLPPTAVERLESEIDAMSAGLPPLGGFTLPGGHPVVSQSHVCRTVCRRAERAVVRAAEQYRVPSGVAEYLNRLSDWLYAAGRRAVEILSIKETYWIP
jgi:cob(I)alamin adenosyltransferase